jgi:hypothetical protein
MSTGYTKLFSSIITSTVWSEPHATRIVWVTMLAMADKNGEVIATVPGLARMASVTLHECEAALACFLSPDPYSRTPDEEGRRVEAIDGGWAIINHAKYRALASRDEAKEAAAKRQQRRRERLSRSVTPCHAPSRSVTVGHACVTDTLHIAEAEAEADTEVQKTPQPPKGGEVASKAIKPKPEPLPDIPPDLATLRGFSEVWAEWLKHRQQERKPVSALAAKKQFKLLVLHRGQAVEMIEAAIRNQWQGIFPPKNATPDNNRYDPPLRIIG